MVHLLTSFRTTCHSLHQEKDHLLSHDQGHTQGSIEGAPGQLAADLYFSHLDMCNEYTSCETIWINVFKSRF